MMDNDFSSTVKELHQKIIHLSELANDMKLKHKSVIEACIYPTPASSSECADAVLPCNTVLHELLSHINRESIGLIKIYQDLILWISLHSAPVFKGVGFGTEIQIKVQEEIQAAEEAATVLLSSLSIYHTHRAKCVNRIIKYPTIDSYKMSLRQKDETSYLTFVISLELMRDMAVKVADSVQKNYKHLDNPSGFAKHLHKSMF
ncbi:putative Proteasome activator pa28 beta subunit [Monocercomonoides exilis]|uniref:putative Proteasome activator pa28 beta subunit n=1 Tax=Monocercomonoides exilis TaxID=2049356 RepID=UPI00355A2916|nr:putative Proteasome activator pa28 beta subunit [Monocercomonoides exilis]|eukprot:MONOS_53.1-p1 / transcript=MONOS_53.1 / gene=MONOS_53 / organism=Monocercomonoides_exilis_PA203 / gene_product=unspecified product / transcript_product=unspecified product / location=Mono_scaffold00001:279125-280035(+) / protein_length=202 / sequence_SO=supercontig / SO=protein_coding / is_pseudo=false